MLRRRAALVALCAFAMLLIVVSYVGSGFDVAGVPRFGLWGMQLSPSQPYTFVVTSLDPGRAADRAGIRPGDVVDMRIQPLIVRFWILDEPIAGRPVDLNVLRDGRRFGTTLVPNSVDIMLGRPDVTLFYFALVWMVGFAALLAWRKPESPDVRLLTLALVFLAISAVIPNFSFTQPILYVPIFLTKDTLRSVAVILWVLYCASFARPLLGMRRNLQTLCITLSAIAIGIGIAAVIGEWTLWFSADSYLPVYSGRGELWSIPYDVSIVLAVLLSAMAVAASRGEERQRAVWALAPLALLFLADAVTTFAIGAQTTYGALVFWIACRNLFLVIAPIGLTYAALGRRLLDIGFVINRALIFGIISLIVVCVFLIVEWGVSELLVNANRTAGTLFSMVVALGLGLSMRPIHRWADRFVDGVFFRKRHEDEAALRRFAHEAAYITDRITLIERAIEEVREHANTRAVRILIPAGDGRYVSAEGVSDDGVGENDRAMVAMRTWHKPVDLQTLDTALAGEYAYPMLSRGRLVGALVCGTKTDGESYAPDEADALFELAHGVGTALDLLGEGRPDVSSAVTQQLAELNRRLDALTALRLTH